MIKGWVGGRKRQESGLSERVFSSSSGKIEKLSSMWVGAYVNSVAIKFTI